VALWLAPGSLWRPCALALLVQWAIAEGLYQAAGNRLPLPVYVAGDLAVLAALVFRGSHWTDWLVALPYPVVWTLYAMPASREQWIWLYWIALGQMVAAGPWVQARQEVTILGEFLHDLAGFIRTRMPMAAARRAAD
jgi:hypothetical protein